MKEIKFIREVTRSQSEQNKELLDAFDVSLKVLQMNQTKFIDFSFEATIKVLQGKNLCEKYDIRGESFCDFLSFS